VKPAVRLLIFALALVAALGVSGASSYWKSVLQVSVGGGVVLTLDGTPATNNASSGTSITTTLTTTKTNDVIICAILINGTTVTGVTDVAGLTWTKHAETTPSKLYIWYAVSTGILSGDVITFNFLSATTFTTTSCWGINGANTASPFDPNASIPTVAASGTVSISTTNADTFIISAYRCANSTPTAGAGFTALTGANFLLTQYQIVTSAQSSLALPVTGCTTNTGGIGDAVTK
jgi:hypothetical protein